MINKQENIIWMFTDIIARVLSGIVCRQIWCGDVSKHRGWNQVSPLLIKYRSSTRIVSKFLFEIVGGGVIIIYIQTSVLIFITRFQPLRAMAFVRCMPLWVTYKEFLSFSLHMSITIFSAQLVITLFPLSPSAHCLTQWLNSQLLHQIQKQTL